MGIVHLENHGLHWDCLEVCEEAADLCTAAGQIPSCYYWQHVEVSYKSYESKEPETTFVTCMSSSVAVRRRATSLSASTPWKCQGRLSKDVVASNEINHKPFEKNKP